ncbi:RabGAP/TBC [Calocera cornea HHB12733]|uniref:RabGAP/TBC n=1 Tax=Calocera cornea HHB12733 TaxID=1353952 RepID=A0A165GNT2_9BASI|nr:RabGAP/TBC [Calocera cornea HHB12733]
MHYAVNSHACDSNDTSFAHPSSTQFNGSDIAAPQRADNRTLAPPKPLQRRSVIGVNSSHESSPVTDSTEVRSSSETTAATIFSMYGEDRHRSSMVDMSSVPKLSTIDKELPSVPPAGAATTTDREVEEPPDIQLKAASEHSPGIASSTHLAPRPPPPENGLAPPSPRVTISTQSSPGTLSRSSSQAYSVQAPDEDDDCYHVRATYARLDHEGVAGDGYEEGIERTRTRVVSSYSVNDGSERLANDLSEKEVEILRSLDRYGFYMVSEAHHEARLALLPASPLKKDLSRVKLSSRSAPPSPPEVRAPPKLRKLSRDKENERIDKWDRMMRVSMRDDGGNAAAWAFDERKGRKLRSRLYKGVPDRWRGAAWWSVIEGVVQGSIGSSAPPTVEQLTRRYFELRDQPSTFDIQIDLDVPRTITGHVLFHTRYGLGQRSLFHVLHSFSLLCQECGYVQGMGPIAATLLCYLQPERAYSCMVRLHDEFHMHAIFQPGFPGLLENIFVQERIMERMLPDVYASFAKNMISSTAYATKWYITLFANVVPFQTQLRIWDAFFCEGRDLMVVMATSVLWALRDYLSSPNATFETILSLLSSYFVPEDENLMMDWIRHTLDDKKLREDMARWRSEWHGLVERGQSARALL